MNNRQREKTAGCCCSSFYSIVPHFNFFIFISHLSSLNSSLLRTTREQQREERGSLFSSLICTAPFSASPALRTLPVFLFFFRQAFAFGVVAHTHSLIAVKLFAFFPFPFTLSSFFIRLLPK